MERSHSFAECKYVVIHEMAKLSLEKRRQLCHAMLEEASRLNQLSSFGKLDDMFKTDGKSSGFNSHEMETSKFIKEMTLEEKLVKLTESIQAVFPHLSSDQVLDHLSAIKKSNNGTLNGLTLDDMVCTIASRQSQEESLKEVEVENLEICVCCQFEIERDDDTRPLITLPECKHVFHKKCISRWLAVSKVCPTCRCPQEFPPL